MPRPRICRRIRGKPRCDYFKPAGIPMSKLNEIVLSLEEYEALRLVDYKDVEQVSAGKKMEISQPTFSRILSSARKKVAEAIVDGKAIRVER
ncbi:DUF134 domain-containing protein [Candidatus Pacearchaeota archaeon]|nr:DUF134 domain-containing protein [Candidatus Pacearchaeota archaeon]